MHGDTHRKGCEEVEALNSWTNESKSSESHTQTMNHSITQQPGHISNERNLASSPCQTPSRKSSKQSSPARAPFTYAFSGLCGSLDLLQR